MTFKVGSPEIIDVENKLRPVAKFLLENPQIGLVRIEGHNDNQGNESQQLFLSEQRAKTVLNWLVKAGIEQKRLRTIGLGKIRPIEINSTSEGRAANNRVEFHIEKEREK